MAVATQACRQADNGAAFIERVRLGTGLKLRIIDPVEEARLAVEGCLNLFDHSSEAVLVVDVQYVRVFDSDETTLPPPEVIPMKLYQFPFSPNCQTVIALAHEVGIVLETAVTTGFVLSRV